MKINWNGLFVCYTLLIRHFHQIDWIHVAFFFSLLVPWRGTLLLWPRQAGRFHHRRAVSRRRLLVWTVAGRCSRWPSSSQRWRMIIRWLLLPPPTRRSTWPPFSGDPCLAVACLFEWWMTELWLHSAHDDDDWPLIAVRFGFCGPRPLPFSCPGAAGRKGSSPAPQCNEKRRGKWLGRQSIQRAATWRKGYWSTWLLFSNSNLAGRSISGGRLEEGVCDDALINDRWMSCWRMIKPQMAPCPVPKCVVIGGRPNGRGKGLAISSSFRRLIQRKTPVSHCLSV